MVTFMAILLKLCFTLLFCTVFLMWADIVLEGDDGESILPSWLKAIGGMLLMATIVSFFALGILHIWF